MRKTIVLILVVMSVGACSLFHKTEKHGCPTNGKNVDAGKLAAGDPKAAHDAAKAPKFKAGKQFDQ